MITSKERAAVITTKERAAVITQTRGAAVSSAAVITKREGSRDHHMKGSAMITQKKGCSDPKGSSDPYKREGSLDHVTERAAVITKE